MHARERERERERMREKERERERERKKERERERQRDLPHALRLTLNHQLSERNQIVSRFVPQVSGFWQATVRTEVAERYDLSRL